MHVDLSYNDENKIASNGGGSKTNYYGKKFEVKTSNHERLLNDGFQKKYFLSKSPSDCYLSKKFEDKTITFTVQKGLKKYMKFKYGIDLFRYPDESYIIEYNDGRKVVKILEKKHQRVEGSVEIKLWSGPSLKREYELILGEKFEVVYGFCVSDFLKKKFVSALKKYTTLNKILHENNISVLFGDDEQYYENLDMWIVSNS